LLLRGHFFAGAGPIRNVVNIGVASFVTDWLAPMRSDVETTVALNKIHATGCGPDSGTTIYFGKMAASLFAYLSARPRHGFPAMSQNDLPGMEVVHVFKFEFAAQRRSLRGQTWQHGKGKS
jgi:hypothetical protein